MKPLTVFLLLLAAVPAVGQVVPKHTYLVGGCKASAVEALEIFKEAKAAPQFDLYIVCDSVNWHRLSAKNDFKESAFAITPEQKGMIWLGPKALSDPKTLRDVIEHELNHLRCDCDLGERDY